MPIDRRNTSSTVGQTGFSSSSAPNGYNPNPDGPDLGRLLTALGKGVEGIKKGSDKRAEDEMTQADMETNQVILETTPLKDETTEEHRARVDAEIKKVRDKWASRDRGFIDGMMQDKDKALLTIDAVHAESKALQLRNTLTTLRTQNPHLTSEEFMNQSADIMGNGFLEIQHMSKETKRDFLKSVNKHTMNEVQQMANIATKRQEQINLAESQSTAYALQDEAINNVLGVNLSEASKSLDTFDDLHDKWDANKTVMLEGVAGSMKQVYDRALEFTNGDKIKASEEAYAFAVSVAEKTGRPEIMDAVKNIPLDNDASGRTLNKFYAKQIDKQKSAIEQQVVKTRNSLLDKRASGMISKNNQHFNKQAQMLETEVMPALRSGDPEEVDAAFDEVRYRIQEHGKAVAAGQYYGNEAHGRKIASYLNSVEKMMIQAEGKPEARRELIDGLANGSWSIEDHNRLAPYLNAADKAKSFETIKPYLEADQEARGYIRTLKRSNQARVINDPLNRFLGHWDHMHKSNKAVAEAMKNNPDKFGSIADLKDVQNRMKAEIERSEELLRIQIYDEEGRAPTAKERRDNADPIIKEYIKELESDQKAINTAAGKLTEEARSNPESSLRQEVDPVLDKASSGSRLSDEEIDTVIKAGNSGLGDVTQLQTALVSGLRNKVDKGEIRAPSQIFKYIASKYNFDLRTPDGKQFMRSILERGLEDMELKLNPAEESPYQGSEAGSSLAGDPENKLSGGVLPGLNADNVGMFLSRALEDNKLISREGIRKLLETAPFWTDDFKKGEDFVENAKEKNRLIEKEIDDIQKIFSELNKKNDKAR